MTNPTRGSSDSVPADSTKDLGFYNPHDGVKGRDGGPYLDFVEREAAEKIRAQKEEREPVTDGSTPAVAGTPLVTAAQLIDNSHTSNVSRANAPGFEVAVSDDTFGDNDFLADPVSVLAVSDGTEAPDEGDGSVSATPGTSEAEQEALSGLSEEDAELAGETASEDPASY